MLSTRTIISSLLTIHLLTTPAAYAACPTGKGVHIIGVRETNPYVTGLGLTTPFVRDIESAFPGSTNESVRYPADGKAGLTDPTYAASVRAGIGNLTAQVTSFAKACPDAKIVIVGYSQGAKVTDDALCGGPDSAYNYTDTEPTIAQFNIRAVLLPGDDRFVPGEVFHVGNATHGGFDARPSGFSCGKYDDKIQLYCDSPDLFCSNGSSEATHDGYYKEYHQTAIAFVKEKLSGS